MKLTQGYQKFIRKLKELWDSQDDVEKEGPAKHTLKHVWHKGEHYLDALQEFTQEEIHVIQEAVKHDIEQWQHVREHYPESPLVIAVKESMWSWLMSASDRNQLEWQAFQTDLEHEGSYQVGDIVNLGTLECEQCQTRWEITHPQTLTNCQVCGYKTFRKVRRSSSHS